MSVGTVIAIPANVILVYITALLDMTGQKVLMNFV